MIVPSSLIGVWTAMLFAQPALAQCEQPTICNLEGLGSPKEKNLITTIDSHGNQTICVNACANTPACQSFAYRARASNNEGPTTYCDLYDVMADVFEIIPGITGTAYWNRNCYGPPKCRRSKKAPNLFVLQAKSTNTTVDDLFAQVAYNSFTNTQGNNLISDAQAATVFTIDPETKRLLDVSEPERVAENFCPKRQENVFFARTDRDDGLGTGNCNTGRYRALTCTIDKNSLEVSCTSSSKGRARAVTYGCVGGPEEFSPNGWLLGGPKLFGPYRRFCSPITLVAVTSRG